jgi:pilus assembly protein CpaC
MFPINNGSKNKWIAGAILVMIIFFMACVSLAAEWPTAESPPVKKISLKAGKSIILKSYAPAKRISIADPEVADFVLISPNEIYVTAKTAGVTNMTVWQGKGVYKVFNLEVGIDVSQLKQQLNEILPEETDLRVTAVRDSITLSGRVSNAPSLSQALALARSHAPEGKVHNLVEVRGVQQVMLEVRVAEMQRSLAKRMGVNFSFLQQDGDFGISQLGGLTTNTFTDELVEIGGSVYEQTTIDTVISNSINAFFRFTDGSTTWTGYIDALKSNGLVKVLAEPTLIALSGKDAYFLAGGEFPIPVPSGDGDITIDYKEFGVRLAFTPTVMADNKISIRVEPEVSELDFSTAVQFEGFVTPGLTTRKAATVVELADGQSFAIAGLLRETARDVVHKFPLLGDIPILGMLFRSRSFQKNETELVIIATPHLVKPLDMAKQTLPTDFYQEPNDTEFYLMGMMEGRQDKQPSEQIQGDLDGMFGHAMPKEQ